MLIEVMTLLGALIAVVGAFLSTGSRIKIGPFEFGKATDKLDEQIDEIATIVEKQKETESSLVKSIVQSIAPITGTVTSYNELTQNIIDKLDNNKSKRDNPTWTLVEGLINSYHRQALRQASIQFWFSLVAAVLGFIIILYAFISASEKNAMEVTITAASGAIIDLIAALFFKQAEQTRSRATELYDRLRVDNQRTIAIDLINSIDNVDLRSVVKAQLALKMGGVDTTVPELAALTKSRVNDHSG